MWRVKLPSCNGPSESVSGGRVRTHLGFAEDFDGLRHVFDALKLHPADAVVLLQGRRLRECEVVESRDLFAVLQVKSVSMLRYLPGGKQRTSSKSLREISGGIVLMKS